MTYPSVSTSLPADLAVAVTPSDTVNLASPCRSVFIGGAGTLVVSMMDGTQVTFTGLAAGQFVPIRVTRIWNTGTTATSIVALY